MAKTLDAIPNLVPLYAKAAAGSAKKRPNSTEIKVDELVVKGSLSTLTATRTSATSLAPRSLSRLSSATSTP